MELRQLRYFVAVAQELHFGRAARRIRVSQPPLSRQISALEKELGVMLLDRTRHHVELTAAGTALYAEAREILAAIERAKAIARSASPEPSGPLHIGFVPAIVSTFLIWQVGEKHARDLLLTGRIIDSAEAYRMGIVNEVMPLEYLMPRAAATSFGCIWLFSASKVARTML